MEQEPVLELSLDPGLYVFSLFTRWPELGAVTHGFVVADHTLEITIPPL